MCFFECFFRLHKKIVELKIFLFNFGIKMINLGFKMGV